MIIAVTGASGYVGGAIARRLGDIRDLGRWRLGHAAPLHGVEAVVHTAWDFTDPWGSVRGTERLVRDAAGRTFVFVSTISAFKGARSDYGRAKLAAEGAVLAARGVVVRPGLVWSERPGSVFGALAASVERRAVPLLDGGRQLQYLVHADDLAELVHRLVEEPYAREPVTAAHARPQTLRAILEEIARASGRRPRFVPVPWRAAWAALRTAELLSLPVPFRSDSVLSLANQNPAPKFDPALAPLFRPFGLAPG